MYVEDITLELIIYDIFASEEEKWCSAGGGKKKDKFENYL